MECKTYTLDDEEFFEWTSQEVVEFKQDNEGRLLMVLNKDIIHVENKPVDNQSDVPSVD